MKIINLGILAHVDAGKTTLTESLLYTSGPIRADAWDSWYGWCKGIRPAPVRQRRSPARCQCIWPAFYPDKSATGNWPPLSSYIHPYHQKPARPL